MSLLHDKVIVITGSSSGIGRGCALECANYGATLILHHLGTEGTTADADALQKEISSLYSTTSVLYGADLTTEGAPEKLIQFAVSKFGRIDVLVNNAAIFHPLPADQVTKSLVQRHVDINYVANYLMTQAATLQMVRQGHGGSIIGISSNTVMTGSAGLAHYAGSKAGVMGFMMNLAAEYGPQQIRFNCVLPGPTDTAMVAEFVKVPETKDALINRCPMGRLGQPKDIAGGVVFFASDLSKFTTGQQIVVDGGSTLHFM